MMARFLCLLSAAAVFASCNDGDGQMVGGDGNFDTLTLSWSGGMPQIMRDGDECSGRDYANVETVTSSPATVAWDHCSWPGEGPQHMVILRGSRALTPGELASVKDALSQVHVGGNNVCGADGPVVTLDIQAHGSLGRYVDDFYGCLPPPDGRTFVAGINALESAVAKLLP
jgi:hypothetical protein